MSEGSGNTSIKDILPETLPDELSDWVEQVVVGIRPLKAEDDYRRILRKRAGRLYEKYVAETKDCNQAQQWVLRDLGDAGEARAEILKEIAGEQKIREGNLWKLPFGAGIGLAVISCIFWICILVIQITDAPLLWESYSGAAPKQMVVSACLTLLLAGWCFYMAYWLKERGSG